ncbi:Thioredoxin_domain-containing protein [Hexamita inflata]|uniref:Thioredoxin_domain-containing protein n=1 Tax=Hexamita inflata TaxID=28002 RepID=A0ABP1GKQ5_9EUKA
MIQLLLGLYAAQQIPGYGKQVVKIANDMLSIDRINKQQNITILVFHAMWCPDCRRNVPMINTVLGLLSDSVKVQDIAVDYQKVDKFGLAQKYMVKNIPTVVVLQNKKEMGRIIENPSVSWETDIGDMMK